MPKPPRNSDHFKELDEDLKDMDPIDPSQHALNQGDGTLDDGEPASEVDGHEKGTHPSTVPVPPRSVKTPATQPDPNDPADQPASKEDKA